MSEFTLVSDKPVRPLVEVENYTHNVGHCQRSGVPIEPMVSTQWFMDVSEMAARGLAAVEQGDLRLVPDTWNKTWAEELGFDGPPATAAEFKEQACAAAEANANAPC